MYKHTNTDIVIRLSDGASVPADAGNADFERYKNWVDAGGEPEPADPIEWRMPLIAAYKKDRALMMARLDEISGRAFRDSDPLKAIVCDTLSDALLAISTHPTVLAAEDIAALELAMEALYDAAVYAAITNPAAPTLLSDFERMDE